PLPRGRARRRQSPRLAPPRAGPARPAPRHRDHRRVRSPARRGRGVRGAAPGRGRAGRSPPLGRHDPRLLRDGDDLPAGARGRRARRLGTSILTEQQLSATLRELAILRVARLSGAEYEWTQHVPIAKAVGVSDAQVDALARDDAGASCFDPVARLVLRFTTEVVERVGVPDALFAEMQRHFSAREIVELVLAI